MLVISAIVISTIIIFLGLYFGLKFSDKILNNGLHAKLSNQ